MPATRTGVSTLRTLCRGIMRLVQKYPGVLINPAVPEAVSLAIGALVAACIAETFDDPRAGEITGQGATP